jgi:hypothetical protein
LYTDFAFAVPLWPRSVLLDLHWRPSNAEDATPVNRRTLFSLLLASTLAAGLGGCAGGGAARDDGPGKPAGPGVRKVGAPVPGPATRQDPFGIGSPGAVTASAQALGRQIALVIGISRYGDERVPRLQFASADARAVWARFVDPLGLRMAPEDAKLLVDEQATLAGIEKMIDWLNEAAGPEDTAIVYFAGHGSVDVRPNGALGGNYLLPYDAQAVVREGGLALETSTGLALTHLQELLKPNRAKELLLIFDACFAGGTKENFSQVTLDPRQVEQSRAGFEALREMAHGRSLLAATEPDEPALELPDLGHGLFTYYFLEGLYYGADRDGKVTLPGVFAYLSSKVSERARAMGHRQSPKIYTAGALMLRRVPRAFFRVGLDVHYRAAPAPAPKKEPAPLEGLQFAGLGDAPHRALPVAAAEGYAATITATDPPVPLTVYLVRLARTAGGALRWARILPDDENLLAPAVTVADGPERAASVPRESVTGRAFAPIPGDEKDAHVLYVLIAADVPVGRERIDALEAPMREAAARADPEGLARAVAPVIEAEPTLKHAALNYVFVRQGDGAR